MGPATRRAGVFTIMTTWYTGRRLLTERLAEGAVPLDEFMATVDAAAAIAYQAPQSS